MKLIVDFVLITGILLVLALLFLTLKSNHKIFTKKLMTFIYSISIGYFFSFYVKLHELIALEILTFMLVNGVLFLLGPLLYLYVKSLFTSKNRIKKKEYLHFALYFIYIISYYTFLIFLVSSKKFSDKYLEFYKRVHIFIYWAETTFFISYIIIALLLFNNYKKVLKTNYSSLDLKNLDWSRRFFIGLLVVMIIDVSTSIYEMFIPLEWETGFLTIIAYIIILIYLGYYGLSKANILIPEFLLKNTTKDSPEEIHKKYNPKPISKINPSEGEELKLHLKNIMKIERPYLDENITLNRLAKLLSISDKKLSELLNQHLNTNFYDWINKYRVESVKKKLISSEDNALTIIEVAYDCGFKSKSSFNRIFKKETGHSPSEYKKLFSKT